MASLIGGALAALRNAAPVPYAAPGSLPFVAMPLARGSMASQMQAMGSVSTLFAVVSAIAEAVAPVEWWVEQVTTDRRQMYDPSPPARARLARHPGLDLLNANPFLSWHEIMEICTQHLKLTGETYWIIVTDPRFPTVPLELWPVRPDRMTPVPDRDRFIAGWWYAAPGGEKVPLGTEEVVQIKLPNPLDPYRGMGAVQALLADLDSVRYSAEWNRRFFLNDATPGGVIEVPDRYSDEEFATYRRRWAEAHRGVRNAHRVAILEGGATWRERAFNMRDMQFTQLREISRDIIREAFRVHKAILGLSDDVNRANAEAADYQLARWNVNPVLSRFAGALNNRVMPLYGRPMTAQYCYASPIPNNETEVSAMLVAQTGAYKSLIEAGVHPDDAAAVAGLPPMRQTTQANKGAA